MVSWALSKNTLMRLGAVSVQKRSPNDTSEPTTDEDERDGRRELGRKEKKRETEAGEREKH